MGFIFRFRRRLHCRRDVKHTMTTTLFLTNNQQITDGCLGIGLSNASIDGALWRSHVLRSPHSLCRLVCALHNRA